MPDLTVVAAAPSDRAAALALAFWHLAPAERIQRVTTALDLIDRGELDPEGIFVVQSGRRLMAAMIAAPVPGAGAAVWPPQVERDTPKADALADVLVRHASSWLQQRGVKLAQALLPPEESARGLPLLRNGFTNPTSLWHLRHYLDLSGEMLGTPERLAFETYGDGDPAVFSAMLALSYDGSQDFPEINGVRTIDEAVAGHQTVGFDSRLWWLARRGDELVGVLLVHASVDGEGWELAYVGVAPQARRRGYGRDLVSKALFETKAAGQPYLSLSVDSRNRPARDLYHDLGFEQIECREVFLAVWGPSGPPSRSGQC